MAFAGMSARDPYAVRAFPESGQGKFGAHSAGAGNTNDPDIGRVLHATDTRQIGCTVAAPVAQKRNNFWFPLGHELHLRFFA